MNGLGPIQKRCRRAFIANPGSNLTTGFLVRFCFPRLVASLRTIIGAVSEERPKLWRCVLAAPTLAVAASSGARGLSDVLAGRMLGAAGGLSTDGHSRPLSPRVRSATDADQRVGVSFVATASKSVGPSEESAVRRPLPIASSCD